MGATSFAARCPSWEVHRRGQVLAASPRGNYQPDGADSGVPGRDRAEGAAAPAPRPRADAGVDGPAGAADLVVSVSEGSNGAGSVDAADAEVAVDRVWSAAEVVGALDLVGLSDVQLEAHLVGLRRPLAVLEAARARAMAEVERRAGAVQDPARRNAEVLDSRRRAAKGQRMSPSEAKRAAEAGSHAAANPVTGRAFSAGDVGPSQVRLLGEALERLPAARRGEAERVLLEAARTMDPVAFGRRVRGYLAVHAPEQLHRQEQGNHGRRRFRMADTEDGGVAFSGLAYGTAAELARTALDAFRRPDTPEERRSPEQRSADAFEQLCAAALRLGEAPTVHGERPQVIVVVEASQLAGGVGAARFAGSGQPTTVAEVGTLLADCEVSRLVRDAQGTPIEVTRNVRTVPVGLWRALVVRDGGCRWQGCDAPASWCDVAHGQDPFRDEGRLSPDNAVLLCRRHHRRFDNGPWRVDIDGDQVTFHRQQQEYIHPLDRPHIPPDGDHHPPAEGNGPPDPDDHPPAGRNGPPDRDNSAVATAVPRAGPPDDRVSREGPVDDPGTDPAAAGASARAGTPPGNSAPGGLAPGSSAPGDLSSGGHPVGNPPRRSASGGQLGLLDT